MRIGLITCVYPPYRGGIGHVAQRHAAMLAEMGHDVEVYCPQMAASDRARHRTVDAPSVHRLRPVLRYGNSALVPQLASVARAHDALWIHYPFFGGAEWGALSAMVWRRPYALSFHMDVTGTGVQGLLLDSYDRLIAPSVLRRAEAVVVSSHDYANHSSLGRHLLRNLLELPYGVDGQVFSPGGADAATLKRLGVDCDLPAFVFVGGMDRPHDFKGVPELLQAFAHARLHDRAQLILVGDGELRPSFERLAAEAGIANRTRFVGRASNDDLVEIYRMATATVLPSTTGEEAFGIVLIEAMACGSPVIASNLPGVRTVVGHGDAARGLLVPPRQPQALAAALARLLDNPGLRDALAVRAVEAASTTFSRPSEAAGLAKVVDRLARASNRR